MFALIESLARTATFCSNDQSMRFIVNTICNMNGDSIRYEPVHGKTNKFGFPQGPTQTSQYSHRSRLEA